jgi:hypothetical protein
MAERLPAHLEAAALLRRAEADGGFGTILTKGDPNRGALLLMIAQRIPQHWRIGAKNVGALMKIYG